MTQTREWPTNPIMGIDLSKPLSAVKEFEQNNRSTLRTVGLVAAGAVLGGIGGVALAKSALLTSGAAAGAASATSARGGIAALLLFLSNNGVPISFGAVGGGGATYVVKQRQVEQVQSELASESMRAGNLQERLAILDEEIRQLRASDKPASQPTRQPTTATALDRQNLTQINGIGPVYAKRLSEAGIDTLDALAALTPERLQEIFANVRGRQAIDEQSWIDQARQLIENDPAQDLTN